MRRVFNMGCGFVCVVPDERADEAPQLLAAHHPGTRRIGTVRRPESADSRSDASGREAPPESVDPG